MKSQLIGTDTEAGKDRRPKEMGMAEDGYIGSLTRDMNLSKLWEIVEAGEAWRAAWGYKESDTTQQLEQTLT